MPRKSANLKQRQSSDKKILLMRVFTCLQDRYGPQHWWPADSPFEVMTGAILTQNTNWRNVETAIASLKAADMLDAERIATCDTARLGELIRASGFFNQKAVRLKAFCRFYLDAGGEAGLKRLDDPGRSLLALHGIGPETADSMLLYALELPVFVIDAYTKRIFTRLGLADKDADYRQLQAFFEEHLPGNTGLFNEYHALIVAHAKRHCRINPLCAECPLAGCCAFAQSAG